MLKKLSLAIMSMGLATTALAGAPGNQVVVPAGMSLIAPTSTSFWSFGVEGLYVKSSSPVFQYAQVSDNVTPDTDYDNQSVNTKFTTGVEFDATYHFAGNSRDVSVAYMHAEMDNSDSTTIGGDETFTDPFDLVTDDVTQIKGKAYNDYNAFDVVFGQDIAIGQTVNIHPFAGLRWGDTESRFNSTYYNVPGLDSAVAATAQMDSEFKGLGPRAGMDAAYHFGHSGVSVVGTLAASLLVGQNTTTTTLQETEELPTTLKTDSSTYVVPELDAKVGLDLHHEFSTATSVNVQAGYMVENYFNAIQNDYIDADNVNTTNNRQNFSFAGPYARFQLNLT